MEIHDTLRNDNGFEQPHRVEKRESLSPKSRQAFRIISLFFYFSLSLSFASRYITRRSKFYSYLNFNSLRIPGHIFHFPAFEDESLYAEMEAEGSWEYFTQSLQPLTSRACGR